MHNTPSDGEASTDAGIGVTVPASSFTPGALGADAASAPSSPPENWFYTSSTDEMRGTTTKIASSSSENNVELSFPYDSSPAQLTIRQRREDGLNVFVSSEGQILCSEYSNSDRIAVKFHEGPLERFTCSEAAGGSSQHDLHQF